MQRCVILALTTFLAAGGIAVRAEDKPSPPAESKDEHKPADPEETALRAAIKSLAKALSEGNQDGIRRAMYAANPTEQKMLDAMAAMAAQIAELHKAAAKAFGEDEAKSLTGDVVMEMGRIDEAEVSIDGDNATVRYASAKPAQPAAPTAQTPVEGDSDAPPPAPPLILKKVDGHWRVPVAELGKDTTPEEIDQRLTDLEAQTKIIAELIGEITQGKYKSAEKAAEAWQGKMMQALLPKKPEEKTPDGQKKPGEAKKPAPAKPG